jgi:predicted transcriptional regulator
MNAARHGLARHGAAWHGEATQLKATVFLHSRRGWARHGLARRCNSTQGPFMTTSIAEMKLETQQLIKLLIALPDGGELTYEEIKKEIGVDVQNGHYYLLRTARKHAERETQRLYGTIQKVGVKRLIPGQSCSELSRAREHIRKSASRAFKRSSHVAFNKLTDVERTELNAERTVLHFTAQVTTDAQTKKLVGAVQKAGDVMNFTKTLEHFKQ